MTDWAFIALLGETGSGKTTFLNRAINSDAFAVGTGLHSCTSEIQVSPQFTVDGHPVALIDTPGFNDTVMDDADVLKDISAFLATAYEDKVKLAGVIYFHKISDERWRRSDTRSFGWLRRICGESTLKNVVLMTNMWSNVDPEVGAAREQQLATEFVKPALDGGARLLRHHNTTESAHVVIRTILENRRTALLVQQELVDEKREFDQTTVGEEVNREVEESMSKLTLQIEDLQNARVKVNDREKETKSRLGDEISKLKELIGKLAEGLKNMNADYKGRKGKASKRWSSFRPPAGVSISCIIIGVLCWGLNLYL